MPSYASPSRSPTSSSPSKQTRCSPAVWLLMTAGTRARGCVSTHEPHVTYKTPDTSECVMSQLLAGLCSSCVLCVCVCCCVITLDPLGMSVLFDWTGAEGSNIQQPTNESDVYHGQLRLDCSRDGAKGKPCVFSCTLHRHLQNAHFTSKVIGEMMATLKGAYACECGCVSSPIISSPVCLSGCRCAAGLD